MSVVYWSTPTREAKLRGSERAWLARVASGPGVAAWRIGDRSDSLERVEALLAMTPGGHYLHTMLAETRQHPEDHLRRGRLIEAAATALRATGLTLHVAGADLRTTDLELNTALVAGSDVIRLAAKIHGWSEDHCWIDWRHREWLAGVIEDGLDAGIYRRGFWYVDRVCRGAAADQPDRKWSVEGWDDVLDLLHGAPHDEPVVLSYSVTDHFPNPEIAGWTPPPMPDGWMPSWADTPKGAAEWVRDYPTEEGRLGYYLEDARELWHELPPAEQWRMAMDGLRRRGWGQLTPKTLAAVTFGPGVTVYDLFAPDRDDRIRALTAGGDDASQR